MRDSACCHIRAKGTCNISLAMTRTTHDQQHVYTLRHLGSGHASKYDSVCIYMYIRFGKDTLYVALCVPETGLAAWCPPQVSKRVMIQGRGKAFAARISGIRQRKWQNGRGGNRRERPEIAGNRRKSPEIATCPCLQSAVLQSSSSHCASLGSLDCETVACTVLPWLFPILSGPQRLSSQPGNDMPCSDPSRPGLLCTYYVCTIWGH